MSDLLWCLKELLLRAAVTAPLVLFVVWVIWLIEG